MVKIKFNFSSNLTKLLTQFDINRIKVTLRNFSSFKNYVYSSETYLFKKYYISNQNEAVCQTNAKDLGLNCYKRIAFTSTRLRKSLDNYIDLSLNYTKSELDKLIMDSNLNKAGYGEHEFLLNSIVFKINAKSNYVVCIKLLKDDMHFFTENMCYDWVISPRTEIHNFHYKPLFIVLMYMLCASILIPIAVWQHFITKAKNKRIKTFKATLLAVPNLDTKTESTTSQNEQIAKSSNSNQNSNRNSADSLAKNRSKDVLTPVLESTQDELESLFKNDSGTSISKNNSNLTPSKKVLFHVNSMESLDKEEAGEMPIVDEADHILNDKPWARTDSVNSVGVNNKDEANEPLLDKKSRNYIFNDEKENAFDEFFESKAQDTTQSQSELEAKKAIRSQTSLKSCLSTKMIAQSEIDDGTKVLSELPHNLTNRRAKSVSISESSTIRNLTKSNSSIKNCVLYESNV